MRLFSVLQARARSFLAAKAGNLAVILALSAIPLTLAMGAGVDYARGLVVHTNMADALDAAGLAVGNVTSKPDSCSSASTATQASRTSCAPLQAVAQQYFNANFKRDSGSTGATPTVVISVANQAVTLTVADSVPTTFLAAADRLLSSSALDSMSITASSTVVWGQTKLWVALVLDNSTSMNESDHGTSKMDALQAASHTLLTTLEGASNTAGDVEVSIIPFARAVNVGTANKAASWLYWGFWEAPGQASGVTITDTTTIDNTNDGMYSALPFVWWGPGDDCPFTYVTTSWSGSKTVHTQSPFGYKCTTGPANSAPDVGTDNDIPDSGTYSGYICPGADPGTYNSDRYQHYYNGCWTSTKKYSSKQTLPGGSSATCTGFSSTNCSCTGSGTSKVCKTYQWTHTWVPNNHSTWGGCITDRDKTSDYDIKNTTPVSTNTTGMPADNPSDSIGCLSNQIASLEYDWDDLSDQIDAMGPHGYTNQAIGVANGWLSLTTGNPYAAPTLPANTARYIILLSDGLNTVDRWYGTADPIDTRMNLVCSAAKNDSAGAITIYTLFLDIGGTTGDSQPLQDCASSSSKYVDLTSNSQVATAFASIAQQITNLRVSK